MGNILGHASSYFVLSFGTGYLARKQRSSRITGNGYAQDEEGNSLRIL